MKTQESKAKVVWVKRLRDKDSGLPPCVDVFVLPKLGEGYQVRLWNVTQIAADGSIPGRFVCYNKDNEQVAVLWNARSRQKEDKFDESIYGRFAD